MLQAFLLWGGYNPAIIIDGDYGKETAKGVKSLQASLGVEEDGRFGPATREAILKQHGLDINSIRASVFCGETIAVNPED